MSQDYTDNVFDGTHVAQTDMENVEKNFAALKSCFLGSSDPSNPTAGMQVVNTTEHMYKIRNEANSAYIDVFDLANSNIPASSIPNDYILSAMLNSTSGSEAVTTDVVRDAAITGDKLDSGAVSDQIATLTDVITQQQLEISSGTALTAQTLAGTTVTLDFAQPGGFYGLGISVRLNPSVANNTARIDYWMETTSTSYVATLRLECESTAGGGAKAEGRQHYVSASPPYKIGDIEWGHFLFTLRNIADGNIVSSWEAPDPPWAYNGSEWNSKNSKERIQEVPHPFVKYFDKDPATDGLEIVLTDLRDIDTKQIEKDTFKAKKYFSDEIHNFKSKGKIIKHADILLPEIIGFTNKVKMQMR